MRKNQQITYNPFENLEDKNTQYWLGMLATDGCISEKNKISLFQKEHSKDIIIKFQKFLQNKVKVQEIVHKKVNGTFPQCGISFRNKEVHDYLNELGITPKKSLTLKLNFPFTWDLMRGIIDGDGSVELNGGSKSRKDGARRIRIGSASISFIDQISEFLTNNEIDHKIYNSGATKSNIFYTLHIHGDLNLIKTLRFLYKDADAYLERKYLNAAQIRNSLIEKHSKLRETASAILKQADF